MGTSFLLCQSLGTLPQSSVLGPGARSHRCVLPSNPVHENSPCCPCSMRVGTLFCPFLQSSRELAPPCKLMIFQETEQRKRRRTRLCPQGPALPWREDVGPRA